MKRLLALLCAAVLTLSGCGRTGPDDVSGFAPAEEDRLVIYTSHKEEVYGPIVKEFEERTGIWVQVESGGTAELLERLAAGGSGCDLMFGGGVDSLEACRDLFEPYESGAAEEIWPAYRGDGAWTPFSALPIVLIYNPKLCRINPPTDWDSLLDPAWRGRIAFADPQVSGSSYTAMATLLQVLPGSTEQVMDAFVQNLNQRLLAGSGDVVTAVADGSCYIGVTLEETALKGIQAGYDIAMAYPESGTSVVPDGMAVVAGCAHGDNARRFIDFALGADVQNYLIDSCARRSVRTDLLQGGAGAEALTLCGYDLAWASSHQGELTALWRELNGEAEP